MMERTTQFINVIQYYCFKSPKTEMFVVLLLFAFAMRFCCFAAFNTLFIHFLTFQELSFSTFVLFLTIAFLLLFITRVLEFLHDDCLELFR